MEPASNDFHTSSPKFECGRSCWVCFALRTSFRGATPSNLVFLKRFSLSRLGRQFLRPWVRVWTCDRCTTPRPRHTTYVQLQLKPPHRNRVQLHYQYSVLHTSASGHFSSNGIAYFVARESFPRCQLPGPTSSQSLGSRASTRDGALYSETDIPQDNQWCLLLHQLALRSWRTLYCSWRGESDVVSWPAFRNSM